MWGMAIIVVVFIDIINILASEYVGYGLAAYGTAGGGGGGYGGVGGAGLSSTGRQNKMFTRISNNIACITIIMSMINISIIMIISIAMIRSYFQQYDNN